MNFNQKNIKYRYDTGKSRTLVEMLMSDGWKPDMNGSALLLALHSTLIEGKAKVDMSNTRPYAFAEALEAFDRVARDHGWSVPPNASVRR